MDSRSTRQYEIEQWLKLDPIRMEAIEFAVKLDLPQWLLSAGFVRDLVWDRLHGASSHPLNDIDLIYFDADDLSERREKAYEKQLESWAPHLPWSVKNQARMHIRNCDAPYTSCEHAMSFWPECETAIGVHVSRQDHRFDFVAPFGFESLFDLKLTHNPKRELSLFNARKDQKAWFTRYPKLELA
ncbi:nucleotidyltransferase family protein [Shewanella benthica]|uniref:nucleotidyltransferase family protein n=1 Tax=Shewanella benthica TaxID=43661 RepID=UPI0029D417E7|nr:nucleotidyltransferase family protein [Shewanella benthica]MCL1062896.1 nucleotidyltransferase family protein [Shewanella benthica]